MPRSGTRSCRRLLTSSRGDELVEGDAKKSGQIDRLSESPPGSTAHAVAECWLRQAEGLGEVTVPAARPANGFGDGVHAGQSQGLRAYLIGFGDIGRVAPSRRTSLYAIIEA